MRLHIRYFLIFFVIIFLLGGMSHCTTRKKKVRKLQNFNAEVWLADKNGCKGERVEILDNLLMSKHLMRGFKISDIEDLLGLPDAQELSDRGQKYYIYFIDPGPKCADPNPNPQALFVRFTAVGIASEFVVRPF